MKELIILITIVIAAIGVVAVYDARKITKKYFASQDQNTMTFVLKSIGFLISIVSGIAYYYIN